MWEPTSETNYFFVEKNVTTQKLRVCWEKNRAIKFSDHFLRFYFLVNN